MCVWICVIDVCGNDKLMLALCPTHCQFIFDLPGLLWGNFSWFKGLASLVKQHILLWDPFAGRIDIGPFRQQHFTTENPLGGDRSYAVCLTQRIPLAII